MFNIPTTPEEQRTQVTKYFGKYPGRVIANKQSEKKAENGSSQNEPNLVRGELIVEVPGILEEGPSGQKDQPIKVIAKPCFVPGFFFIPEEETPVWVEFAAGDINQPLWSGIWYPEDGVPKTVDDKPPKHSQRVIHTTSHHIVQIDDTENDEKVIIKHKGGATLEIDKESAITIKNAKITLEMKKDGTMTIQAQSGIELKASQVTLDSDMIKLGGTAAVQQAILGTTFIPLYMAHTHATAVGPSGPPLPPLVSTTVLSNSVKVKA